MVRSEVAGKRAMPDITLEKVGPDNLADCGIAEAGDHITDNHAPWAYDSENAARLWALSNSLLKTDF